MSDSFPGSRQNGKEKEWGDHNSITINVPSQKEIAKNKEFFASVLRKLRDGKHKDDFSSSGNTDSDEEEQTMSYEEIAIYVDTKARYLFFFVLNFCSLVQRSFFQDNIPRTFYDIQSVLLDSGWRHDNLPILHRRRFCQHRISWIKEKLHNFTINFLFSIYLINDLYLFSVLNAIYVDV